MNGQQEPPCLPAIEPTRPKNGPAPRRPSQTGEGVLIRRARHLRHLSGYVLRVGNCRLLSVIAQAFNKMHVINYLIGSPQAPQLDSPRHANQERAPQSRNSPNRPRKAES